MLVHAACTAFLNGGPELRIFCANSTNYEKEFCTGDVSNYGSLEDYKLMTHKFNKAN